MALALPAAPNNKIAYYAFDATPKGTPVVNLSLTTFDTAAIYGGTKAGIMVFAGNVDSAYTNTIFRSVH